MRNKVFIFAFNEAWKEIFLIYVFFLLATQPLFDFLSMVSSYVTLQALLYYPCFFLF